MTRTSKFKNILSRRKDLWNNEDSESDRSSISDTENKKIPLINCRSRTSSDENSEPCKKTCCLICSVLPNLTDINTCEKHLNLLTKPKPAPQVVYMVPPTNLHCHCRSKSKRRHRSSSSSSTSSSPSERRSRRKKRSRTVQSSSSSIQSDLFLSPNIRSRDNQQHHFNDILPRLSPSLPPSSTNINQNLRPRKELFFGPLLSQHTNSSDIIQIDSDASCSPVRIVHVKDDKEILNEIDQNKSMMNMSEATKQMVNNEFPQPIILLERVHFER